jgi:hypothetical protein
MATYLGISFDNINNTYYLNGTGFRVTHYIFSKISPPVYPRIVCGCWINWSEDKMRRFLTSLLIAREIY